MLIDTTDETLLATIADGLPLVAAPYAAVGEAVDLSETEVIARLRAMIDGGVIKRFGVIVRHHELGFAANAMVVWDIDDAEVATIGKRLAATPCVTLCYERPRRLPDWPYNLFAMIHGKDRESVLAKVAEINAAVDLAERPNDVLFSLRRFKQRGARYCRPKVMVSDLHRGAA